MAFAWKAAGLTYNRYLAVAAQTVRRSLKPEIRVKAEAGGAASEMRYAKWENGKPSDPINLPGANAAADAAASK